MNLIASLKKPQVDGQNKDAEFSQGKPIAAFTICECLIHRRLSVYDRLIQMIGSAIKDQDNNDHMPYWLSNTSTLFFLIQKGLKHDTTTSFRKPPPAISLFRRTTMVTILNYIYSCFLSRGGKIGVLCSLVNGSKQYLYLSFDPFDWFSFKLICFVLLY
ncbi:myosin-14-like [Rutidosis leptorrhynchoides]|uniref:myosin-14-like n=1 Tax=Rutidosis leptorrhynchoides TaxID=125765 RepID=UPI003A99BA4B